MGVNLIFKIAAGGDSGFRYLPGIKTQRKRRTGFSHQSGRSDSGFILDGALYL